MTAAQNAALRGAAATLLGGIDAIPVALNRDDWRAARRLRWRFECLSRLLDDLGWSDKEPQATTAITMSPSELSAALAWIAHYSRQMLDLHREEVVGSESELQRHQAARAACRSVRQQLPFATLVSVRGWR